MQELIDKCEKLYYNGDYNEMLVLCDEILNICPQNQIALGYKSSAYIFLNQPQTALEILKKAIKIYPDNYYFKNNCAMAYYNLGEYEKSLKCCDEGLMIKDFYLLYKNKIKALLKLERIDEAIEVYNYSRDGLDIIDLFMETEKYSQAVKYCLDEDLVGFELIVDKIKDKYPKELDDYYISWIYKIKSKSDIRFCEKCGGKLVPIVWGLPHNETIKKAERGEIALGGCCIPINHPNYHCKNCHKEFNLGCEGLHIECGDGKLNDYIEYKIMELTDKLKKNSTIYLRTLKSLKKELKGYDDDEFNAFINHLKDLDYICEPQEGLVMLVGYDDFKCMMEYPDPHKFNGISFREV